MDEMATRLMKCFAAVFPELTREEILAATPASVKSWDSVATLNLLTVVEEEFGVEIDFASLLESLSYEKLAAYVQQRIEIRDNKGAA